ncbi:MAG: redox-sensing transcriptional repressor Rex [Actinomycetota bacterium]|nr:redox-sensing transcriptional repressor Rex [Actinomycetota bacterium]
MSARRLPEATVARLPVYLRVLAEVADETISSDDLASGAGVNAAQVRKDLSHLGSYGTRGVGYDVAYLVRQISRQLGLSEDRRVAIVGVGNLGHALAGYGGFVERGFRIVAAFDVDPRTVGQRVGGVLIEPLERLADVVSEKGVEMALLTTPATAAQAAADAVVAAGVNSILNFAPARVEAPAGVAVRQVDLGVELQILSYYGTQAAGVTSQAG